MKFGYCFMWTIIWGIGFIFTYYVWITPEFNSLRIKNHLISKSGMDYTTKSFIKEEFKFMYVFLNLRIIILSLVISGVITVAQAEASYGRQLETFHDLVTILIPVSIMYLLLSGIKESKSNGIEDIGDMIIKLKLTILNIFIEKEKQLYINCIDKKIKYWYRLEFEKDSNLFAVFILRLCNEFFLKTLNESYELSNATSESEKNKIYELHKKAYKIMFEYVNDDKYSNLISDIKYLFDEYFELDASNPYSVISFISHTKLGARNKSREEVVENIKETLEEYKHYLEYNKEEYQYSLEYNEKELIG